MHLVKDTWAAPGVRRLEGLGDGLSFAWKPLHLLTDERFHVRFAANEEIVAHACKLVGAIFCNRQSKRLHRLLVDQHGSSAASACSSGSSALNLSWLRTH